MAHKTLINGVVRNIVGGKSLVDGTSYNINGGKTLIDGTTYDIKFLEDTYAMLYSDGDFVFQLGDDVAEGKTLTRSYSKFIDVDCSHYAMVKWYYYVANIKNVYFKNETSTASLSHWFYNCRNLMNINYTNFNYDNVINMSNAYYYCTNLTGSPVCGSNVTNMFYAYYNCTNLTGSPVCGENVTNMSSAYYSCNSLIGSPVCGNNVRDMNSSYYNCKNMYGNMYMYANSVINVRNCFYGRNTSNMLNIYVHSDSTTLTTCLYNNTYSLVGSNVTWTDDTVTNGCYYNTTQNIYIYPVTNVSMSRLENEYDTTINPIESDYVITNNTDIILKEEYTLSTTELNVDSGRCFTTFINVNVLENVTIENMEVK